MMRVGGRVRTAQILMIMGIAALCAAARGQALAQEPPAPLTFTLGAGAARVADYEGAKRQQTVAFPIIGARLVTDVGVFGIGGDASAPGATTPLLTWAVGDGKKFVAGWSVTYDGGRRDDRHRTAFESGSPRLRGLGNLPGTLEYGLFGAYTARYLTFNLDARTAPRGRGHGGSLIDASVDFNFPLNGKTSITASPGLTWASDRYTRRYFGVTAQQSAASGFARYDPKGGLKNFSFSVAVNSRFDAHWSAFAGVTASRLLGDAARSPIVQRRTSLSPNAGIAYNW